MTPVKSRCRYKRDLPISTCRTADKVEKRSRSDEGCNVKIDPTIPPTEKDQTSECLNSLGAVMLQLMGEIKRSLSLSDPGRWSAEAVDFVEATSRASLDELSYHRFMTGANEPKTLTALCFVSNLKIDRGFSLKGPFLKMWE